MQPKAIIPSRLHVAHSRPRAPSGAVWAPFIYVPPTSNSSETSSASKNKKGADQDSKFDEFAELKLT